MPGHATLVRTYVDGNVLSASNYVGDLQQFIDDMIPTVVDNYSANVSQMQSSVSPGDVGSESLATTLAGELERIRYVLRDIKTKVSSSAVAQWYSTAFAVGGAAGSMTLLTEIAGTLVTPVGSDSELVTITLVPTSTKVRISAFVYGKATNVSPGGSCVLTATIKVDGTTRLTLPTQSVNGGANTITFPLFTSGVLWRTDTAASHVYSLNFGQSGGNCTVSATGIIIVEQIGA